MKELSAKLLIVDIAFAQYKQPVFTPVHELPGNIGPGKSLKHLYVNMSLNLIKVIVFMPNV
ncbi:hypothetical protein [Shewanella litoralis]|uniref:Uncharacterized protein n=1 Tax=Shewanella litoralis TaxID=2282700 RepID=A0ABQ2RC01_9GAMM|nr:hypothetical protein [Shewanella litoralis]GGQ21581.1 hypothetical protein GCM10009411_22090 [Shewanella litoralis]